MFLGADTGVESAARATAEPASALRQMKNAYRILAAVRAARVVIAASPGRLQGCGCPDPPSCATCPDALAADCGLPRAVYCRRAGRYGGYRPPAPARC